MKTIPGAVLFDIEKASYKTKTVIRELYTPDKFEEYVQSLGVDSTSHIVVFDRSVPTCGILGSARAWWLFKVLHRHHTHLLHIFTICLLTIIVIRSRKSFCARRWSTKMDQFRLRSC